ncbi:MAG: RNA pseudouridine synthase, partial [Lutibacter sp.]|uniref:RluA family pseudouridine synthase n=1 Tax=Lutibacter sp. TaxID=1925666 RepID=UPI00385F8D0D
MASTKNNLHVLFEDNHFIVINKQSGDIVQGDKTGDTPLSDIVKEYIKEKYNKPGNVFLGVVHRLDRPTTGVVVFARTSKALERFNKMLRDKTVHKTYWAVVKNKPKKDIDTLIGFLKKNPKNNKSTSYSSEIEGSKKAILHYKLLKSLDNYHLLEVDLETGRHHQIRCQLATIGSPIKGDLKYGFNRSNKDASIHLHA